MAAAELECGVCLTLPEGEVHQCNEGHCYCVTCWRALDPRRCPECRQPIQDSNRNRDREARVAALEATCDHCAAVTTHGAMNSHLRICPQRPTTCTGATAGCGWSGMAADQAPHEEACPIAICQRMMAPVHARCDWIQAHNQQMQSDNQELRARVASLEPQNQQLQQRVAALEPLAGQVRALEDEEEEGGRQRRQRVGAAPHDAPPSDADMEEMGLAEAVAALREHVAVARVAEKACVRLHHMSVPAGNGQAAAEAGVIEAVVEAMQAHPQVAAVQLQGCAALAIVCCGNDAAGRARKQRAAAAGALEVVVAAMWAHSQFASVQRLGCMALSNVCSGHDATGLARPQRAADAGAFEVVVAAMRAHSQVSTCNYHTS